MYTGRSQPKPETTVYESAPTTETPAKPGKRRPPRQRRGLRWWQNLLIGTLAVILVLVGTAFGTLQYYNQKVERSPLLPPHPGQSTDWGDGPLNLLLFGADTTNPHPDDRGRELDTIMLVHFNKALDHASVISIPRQAYVDVPAAGSWPGGKTTIDRAIVLGGPVMVAKTVEQLTGIEFDGAMVAGLNSVKQLVDAVGGITICTANDEKLPGGGVRDRGCHDLDGTGAQNFMQERTQGGSSDFARIDDQQRVVKALIAKASSGGVLANPLKLNKLLSTTANALLVDNGLDLSRFALSIRRIRPADVQFVTAPVTPKMITTPVGPAVQLDPTLTPQMFKAVKDDSINGWLGTHRSSTTK